MQRAGLATLGPMLAAAALVIWGGERLARRSVEEREPVDRVRLLDFSATLGEELDRLDDLYQSHLAELVTYSAYRTAEMNRRCETVMGVRSLTVFGPGGKRTAEYVGARPPVSSGRHVPGVELDAVVGARATNVISLPKPPDEALFQQGSGWVPGNDGVHRLFWSRPGNGSLVAVVLDDVELQGCLDRHLRAWAQGPFAPLAGTHQLATVYGPRRSNFFPIAEEEHAVSGPAALLIPHRTALGEWQVQAWDRLEVREEHDVATLLVSSGIACTLVLAGIYLNISQGRALRLAEERVSFVNRVSHELGTPLTNILLNLDLAGRAAAARPAESRRRLQLVDEEVRRLARLVANVLTFSRGERKTLELRPGFFIPDEVVGEVLSQFEPALERAGIRVERTGQAAERCHGDADAFSQIVGNLVSNVEKYAAGGGWIGVGTRLEGGRLRVTVADAGPGIPARARRRIFQPFERVSDGLAEGSSGTGLGLAIARDLAVRMGGTLVLREASSVAGESSRGGAVFELDLPAAAELKVYVSGNPAA